MYCFQKNENYKKNKLDIFQFFYKFIFLNFKIVYFFFNLLLVFTKNSKVYQKKKNYIFILFTEFYLFF